MDFYPAKNNDRLNRFPFAPEAISGRVMVNPRYPIRQLAAAPAPWYCDRCLVWHTFPRVRCDSGAFQDVGPAHWRRTPRIALVEQLRLEEQLRWHLNDESFHFETVFIYDQPAGVDEQVIKGKKVKKRGTLETAARAVVTTLEAAHFYASQRERIRGRIGFVGQGINADQYEACVRDILPLMQPGDLFAFGGFCIWGRMPRQITPIAHATISRVVPLLVAYGITEMHLLGVMYAPGVLWTAKIAAQHELLLATDGSGPEQAGAIAGRIYKDGRQADGGYTKEQKYKEYHPCALALQNIRDYTLWSNEL